jgi:nicotinamide-nucleotide amidase
MRFDVISQGEELVSGNLVDSNAAHICAALGALGLVPGRISCVGDELDSIRDVLREAAARSQVVVCTGGLGPTSDDLTAEAVAAAFERPLYEDAAALAQIEARYASRKREMPPRNRKQAWMPRGAAVLENLLGTAPGFRVEQGESALFFLPGPPFEMAPMLDSHVLPWVRARHTLVPRRTVLLRCIGLPESVAAQRMDGFERSGVTVGYRAALPEVHVKLHLEAAAQKDETVLVAEARARLGDHVFGVNGGPLEDVVGELLASRGHSVAVAESCTGGRLGAALTARPGASAYFLGGALVYSNAEKTRQCDVPEDVLATHGAVSEPAARALAEGIRRRTGATWGLSVTGIAGPGGGTPEKPVGTVHLAVSGPEGIVHRKILAPYDRARIMRFSVGAALDLLRRAVLTS